jgi:hypothetical protein
VYHYTTALHSSLHTATPTAHTQVAISLLFIPKYLQIQADTDASSVVPGAPSSPNGNLGRKSDATTKNKKVTRPITGSKMLSAESDNDYCNSVRAETGPPSPYRAHSAAAASNRGTANVAAAAGDITGDTTATANSVPLGAGFAANRAARLSAKAKGSQRISPDA